MEKTVTEHEGNKYEMGSSFSEVKKGDVIEVEPGKLEIILSVAPLRSWEGVAIHTNSGTYYSFFPNSIISYGKRIS
ncbi:MAG: hypothetical protein Q8P79_03455 [Nanoarchaeota archaeon]|nr:hypothetical protein [Nanoarchaeota archaeon]